MNDQTDKKIGLFLSQTSFAVAGASTNPEKYGNKVVRVYKQNDRTVYPLNPKADEVEGLKAYPDIASVPESSLALSVVTPPRITLNVVEEALKLGVRHIWMQPGAENKEAIEKAESAGAIVIHGGPCVLVALGYHE
ncbi:MAG: CoA-binding protein [Proteobacteria bacterium]|nr:CoA-binding protein [Pseudomonadota bacterium]